MNEQESRVLIDEYVEGIKIQMIVLIDWLRGQKDNCPYCAARLVWCKDAAGYDHPMDIKGNNHFHACGRRDEWVN